MAGGAEVRGHDRVFVLLGEGGEHWGSIGRMDSTT